MWQVLCWVFKMGGKIFTSQNLMSSGEYRPVIEQLPCGLSAMKDKNGPPEEAGPAQTRLSKESYVQTDLKGQW